jgi:hypothetical protein
VIARPERDADEGKVALERDGRDRGQRAVTTRHPERIAAGARRLSRDLTRVLALSEDVGVESHAFRFPPELRRRGTAVARARVDEQKA